MQNKKNTGKNPTGKPQTCSKGSESTTYKASMKIKRQKQLKFLHLKQKSNTQILKEGQ